MMIYESIFSDMVFTDGMIKLLKLCRNGNPTEDEYGKLEYSYAQFMAEILMFEKQGLVICDRQFMEFNVIGLTKKCERVLKTLACIKEIPEEF